MIGLKQAIPTQPAFGVAKKPDYEHADQRCRGGGDPERRWAWEKNCSDVDSDEDDGKGNRRRLLPCELLVYLGVQCILLAAIQDSDAYKRQADAPFIAVVKTAWFGYRS